MCECKLQLMACDRSLAAELAETAHALTALMLKVIAPASDGTPLHASCAGACLVRAL
jgi:hypothetical protein